MQLGRVTWLCAMLATGSLPAATRAFALAHTLSARLAPERGPPRRAPALGRDHGQGVSPPNGASTISLRLPPAAGGSASRRRKCCRLRAQPRLLADRRSRAAQLPCQPVMAPCLATTPWLKIHDEEQAWHVDCRKDCHKLRGGRPGLNWRKLAGLKIAWISWSAPALLARSGHAVCSQDQVAPEWRTASARVLEPWR
jgi:hypothetical protein